MLMSQERAVKVIQRLKDLGLTRREVADAVGVSERAVYHWLSYEREPRLNFMQLAKMCDLLGWTPQELADAYYAPGIISSTSE